MALQKKYKIALETKLEQLWHQGYCVLERWELVAWFDKGRITNVVWREIQETWDDMFDINTTLRVIKCDETTPPQKYVVIQKSRAIEMSVMSK